MQVQGRLWGISRLKLAVMVPFAVFVLVLALGVSVLEYQKAERDSARFSRDMTAAVDASFRASVSVETGMLRAVAETIMANDALAAAFRSGDRARLNQLAGPILESVKRSARVSHLYFTDVHRVNVLRVHQPERFGDVIDRQTTLAAEVSQKPESGIELGPLGTLTLRVVVPWYDRGRLLGYVETGKEVDDLFSGLRDQFSVHPMVFIPKDRLDRAGWEKGQAMLGRPARWDEFKDVVLNVRTGIPTAVVRALIDAPDRDAYADGRWYVWRSLEVPDPSGNPLASVGLVVDVTPQHRDLFGFGAGLASLALIGSAAVIAVFSLVIGKVEARLSRASNELAQREALYHSLFSRASAAMLLVDPEDGAIVDANDQAVAYYGCPHSRLTAMTMADIGTGMAVDLAAEGSVLSRHRRADGESREVEIHATPIEVGGRRLLYAIIHDVSDRCRAEERLRESEERFRSLIENTTDWVWETDGDHRLTWLSPSVEAVLGISVAQAVGKRRWELASERHKIDPTRWVSHLDDLAARRPFRDFRYWIKTENGMRWVTVSGAPRFAADGQFLGYRGSGTDISPYAAIAQRLRTMSKVVEQSPVSVLIADPDGSISYVNPHFKAALGYSDEDVLGRHLRSFDFEALPSETVEAMRAVVVAGGTWTDELKTRRKDGSWCWKQEVVFPVTNEEGSLVHMVCIREDVSKRKEAEARLVEQMRLTHRHYESLRALSEIAALSRTSAETQLAQALALGCRHLQLPMGIISQIDGDDYTVRYHSAPDGSGLADGQVYPLSDTYCAITMACGDVVAIPHMKQSEHAGHPCYGAFGLETYIGMPVTVRGARFGTVNFSSAEPFCRDFDDGDLEFMRLLSRIVGAVMERGFAAQEVQQALASAEAARRRIDLLLSSAGEGIVGIGVEGQVEFLNPTARRLLGYAVDAEVIGVKVHDVTGHTHADGTPCRPHDCGVLQTLRDGIGRRSEGDFYRRRDGVAFPIESTITATTENGRVTGAVVVFRDITQRLAAEKALSDALKRIEGQAAELSRINAELEQFAYVASHDLRQPLRMVSSYLRLIEKTLGDDLSEDLETFLGFAIDGAKRMDSLILDLLEYSRTGRRAGPFTPVPLAEAIAESLANLKAALDDADARVTMSADLPVISGDYAELVRLFQNLVGNAVKYRSPDRSAEVEIGHKRENGEVVVWVRDNGIGIAPEFHDRAFQIFQRLVPRDQYEGTGIGLAICKKIVTNHGGRIWIDSDVEQGCRFSVAFPAG